MMNLAFILSLNANIPVNRSFIISSIFLIAAICTPYILRNLFPQSLIMSKAFRLPKLILLRIMRLLKNNFRRI
jgi:hypothetical protein